jgi:hypothetical protein
VQAALIIAKRFPRDEAAAEQKILRDCTRPSLADAAIYEYKRGTTAVTGPSIRLAEVIKRAWGNIKSGWQELERRGDKSLVRAYAWDQETNVMEERTFEVRQVRVTAIWENGKNTGRKMIKPLEDERDIYENNANQAARRVRACILALIPGDIIENAVNQCTKTLEAKEVVTVESIAQLVEAFKGFKVTKEMLTTYVGRNLAPDALSAAMMVRLRNVYKSIKDGVGTVEEFFHVSAEDENKEIDGTKADDTKSNSEKLKEKAAAKTSPEPEAKKPDDKGEAKKLV